MKNDVLFRSSVIFADLVLFSMLCFIAVLGTATAAGEAVVAVGMLVTGAAFVVLCDMSLNWAEHRRELAARA